MSPITHALAGWAVASSTQLSWRERGFITLAAIIPDFDGVGIVVDLVSKHSDNPTDLWGTYHHILGHNLMLGVLCSVVAFMLSTRRWATAGLVFVSFHLHLLGDVLGGRGPDGDQWPIPYFFPLTRSIQWVWSGQWALNAWPNFLVTAALLILTFYIAWRDGVSPLEYISAKANRTFVEALRSRFGEPTGQ